MPTKPKLSNAVSTLPSFGVDYVEALPRLPSSLLCVIGFGDDAGAFARQVADIDVPRAHVAMAQLQPQARLEVWTSPTPVARGHALGFDYAYNDEVLCGVYNHPLDAAGFEAQVESAYSSLRRLLIQTRFPHLLRVWNYFPDIGKACGDLDRYKCFCRARAGALGPLVAQAATALPAASAVGSHGGNLVIYFFAGIHAGCQRENPRQVSAYRYPPKYGPRSPSFARATLTPDRRLLISGTASIVGHESRHLDDLPAQLEETLENLRAVIASTEADMRVGLRGLADLRQLKVYLRHAADYAFVAQRLGEVVPAAQCLYLLADVCREELLLEIEGVAGSVPV